MPAFLGCVLAASLHGDSTINPTNRAAWGANIGWIDWRGDVTHGAVIGEYVCSGSLYAANTGWINLGSGRPANGIAYLNNTADDFGVNHDGLGNLHGLAWGANVGWLLFTNRDAAGRSFDGPRIDLVSGSLSGRVFGANIGWITLINSAARVQTDRVLAGADSDLDGIADAFETLWAGGLSVMNGTSDLDGDGSTDRSEYLAATNPGDPADRLQLTQILVGTGGATLGATWTSSSSRFYHLQQRAGLGTNSVWLDSGLGLIIPDGGPTTTRTFPAVAVDQRFLRVEAVRPLTP